MRMLLALLLLLAQGPGPAQTGATASGSAPIYAPTLVAGSAVGTDNSSTSASSISTPAHSNAAGHGLGVFIRIGNGTTTVSSVTDTAGDTFTHATLADAVQDGSSTYLWYTCNTAGNANNVVTAALSSSVAFNTIQSFEFQNQNPSACYDNASSGTNTTSSFTVTATSFSVSASSLVAAVASNNCASGSWTAGTGYTILLNQTASGIGSEYQQGFAGGSAAPSMTFGASGCAVTISAGAFK